MTNWISMLPKFVMRHLQAGLQLVSLFCITDYFNFGDFNLDASIDACVLIVDTESGDEYCVVYAKLQHDEEYSLQKYRTRTKTNASLTLQSFFLR